MSSFELTMNTRIQDSLRKFNEFIIFVVLVYAFSWTLLIPIIYNEHILWPITSIVPYEVTILISSFIPSIIGLGIIFLKDGRIGVYNLFQKFKVRFEKSLWIILLFFFPVVFVLIFILANFFIPIHAPRTVYSDDFFEVFILFLLIVIGGELGWRGYALDRLQTKLSVLTSSIIVGFFWGLFYLPIFLSGGFFIDWWNFPIVLGTFVVISIMITSFYNRTNQSLLATLLFNLFFHLMLLLFYFNYIIGGNLTTPIVIPFFYVPLDTGIVITFIVISIFVVTILKLIGINEKTSTG